MIDDVCPLCRGYCAVFVGLSALEHEDAVAAAHGAQPRVIYSFQRLTWRQPWKQRVHMTPDAS